VSERTLHVIYSDDIRYEQGGKVSLIGCYNADMVLPYVPIALPKLCISSWLSTPVEAPFRQLSFRVYMDSELIADWEGTEPDFDELPLPLPPPGDPEGDIRRRWVTVNRLELSSFTVPKECFLRYRAVVDGEEVRGNGLIIRTVSPKTGSEAV